jgi:hypothetical protein
VELLAKKMDRSKNYIINQAVGEYLEREVLADHRWQETLAALESMGQLWEFPLMKSMNGFAVKELITSCRDLNQNSGMAST